MVLERTANEVIIRLPANINWEDLELMIRFIKYKQNVSKSEATQEDMTSWPMMLTNNGGKRINTVSSNNHES